MFIIKGMFDGYYLLIQKLWQILDKTQQWPEKCALPVYYAVSRGNFVPKEWPLLPAETMHSSDLFKGQKKNSTYNFEPVYKNILLKACHYKMQILWDMRFSRPRWWRFQYYGVWPCVNGYMGKMFRWSVPPRSSAYSKYSAHPPVSWG